MIVAQVMSLFTLWRYSGYEVDVKGEGGSGENTTGCSKT